MIGDQLKGLNRKSLKTIYILKVNLKDQKDPNILLANDQMLSNHLITLNQRVNTNTQKGKSSDQLNVLLQRNQEIISNLKENSKNVNLMIGSLLKGPNSKNLKIIL